MITDSLSDSKLKWGYWYVTRKLLLRQILIYFLLFINLNLWFFAAFFVFKVYFFDNQQYVFAVNKLSNSGVNYSTFNQANQPKELAFGNIDVLKSGDDKYDLILKVKNLNPNWLARVSGKFTIGQEDQGDGNEREDSIINILDEEEKYIILSGVVSPSGVSSPQFKINYIQWSRIRNHDVFNSFVNDHANFEVSDVKYKTPSDLKLGSQVQVGGLSFKIKNNSLYDYWRVDNKILFKRAGNVVAAHIFPVEEFKIDQQRVVDFRIFNDLINISSAEVYPEADIFDENNIMDEPFAEGYLK